tara:strand:+ start:4642 stop:4779 length:138 start_codon:yes stop_codon:yes gene_type:complete
MLKNAEVDEEGEALANWRAGGDMAFNRAEIGKCLSYIAGAMQPLS